jgi:transcriptional regulator with XRE-family HTH domain
MTFGEKVRQLRTQRGMTQPDLAAASGLPVGTIRDYEQGRREPLLGRAQLLARALGVSLDVFPPADAEAAAGKGATPRPARRAGKGK